MEELILNLIALLFKQITSTGTFGLESVSLLGILGLVLLILRLFKRKLPWLLISKKNMDLVVRNIRRVERDIVDLNSVFALELESIIRSHIRELVSIISSFLFKLVPNEDQKTMALTLLAQFLITDLNMAVHQMVRENGFTKYDTEKLRAYAASKEFVIYDIISRNCSERYLFNGTDKLSLIWSKESEALNTLRSTLSLKWSEMFRAITEHSLKCEKKISELLEENSNLIKDL